MAEIFLGRNQELRAFKATMACFWEQANELPTVALVHGQGGIGKTTLLKKFLELVKEHWSDRFLHLDINWQETRFGKSNDGDNAYTEPEQVLNFLGHEAAKLPRWEKAAFHQYRKRLDKAIDRVRDAANRLDKVEEAPEKETGWTEPIVKSLAKGASTWVGAGWAAPALEYLAKQGIRILPRQAEKLWKKLEEEDRRLIQNAHLHLAEGLGEGFAMVAVNQPILVSFDTYELVDGVDPLIRRMIERAGERVFWIIAGRHDLYETREDTPRGRIDGYREYDGHRYDVVRFDPRALAREDIRNFFREAAPDKPELDDEAVARVDTATRAVPLAVRLAVDIWKKTGDLDRITDHHEADDVVRAMVRRYQQHCPANNDDRRALRAMALANGDREILVAMLKPEHNDQLHNFLKRVRHRYAAVQHTSEGRLHDVPAAFFREDMRDRPDDEVVELVKRALHCVEARIEKQNAYHLRLEDLCEDSDYGIAVVRKAGYLFWLDETQAWAWMTARMVEALPFVETRIGELVEEAEWFQSRLSGMGKKRLAILPRAGLFLFSSQTSTEFRNLLHDDIEGRGYLKGDLVQDKFRDEVKASWAWYQADFLRREERYDEALEAIMLVSGLLQQKKSPRLRRAVADTALTISYHFFLRKEYRKMQRVTSVAVTVDPDYHRSWREYGTAHSLLKQYDKAIEFHQKALDIDPNDAGTWRELGTAHSLLNQYDKAIEFHQKALDINPNDAIAWRELGTAHGLLKQYDKAIEFHQKALDTDPNDAIAWRELGNDHSWLKQYDKAIEFHQKALDIDPNDAIAWRELCAGYQFLGLYDKATSAIERALDLEGDNSRTWAWKGYLAMIHGQIEAAEDDFAKALMADQKEGMAWRCAGALAYRRGRLDVAGSKYKQAVTAAPKNLEGFLDLAAIQRLNGENTAASANLAHAKTMMEGADSSSLAAAKLKALTDDPESAINLLEIHITEAPGRREWIPFCPAFHWLRDHDRFRALARNIPGSRWSELEAW